MDNRLLAETPVVHVKRWIIFCLVTAAVALAGPQILWALGLWP